MWSRYFLNVRRQTTFSTSPPTTPPTTPSTKPLTTEPPHITTHKKTKGPRGKSSADTLSPRAILILKSLSVAFVGAGIVFSIYLGRPFDGDRENQYKDLSKLTAWYKRFQAHKLLPDKNSLPNYSPYTLVINLDQTLIYSTWDVIDYFLFVASNLFEVVIFTSQPSYVKQILMKLDPLAMVPLRLYRESTRYVEGKIVKDLSKLNRDLSKVIIMDSNPDAYSLQPENAIAIPPWKGDPNDTFLIDIIPFLEHFTLLSPYEIHDVRPILKLFQGKDVPKAYAEWEEQWKKQRQMEYEKAKKEKKGLASFVSAIGFGSTQEIPPYQQALLHRQMAHDGLLQHYKSLKEQSPELQRAMKQDMDNYEKQIAERMKEQKMTLWQLATQGPPQILYTGMQEQQQQSDYQNYQTSPQSSASQ
ncbi:2164_t:CDS:10 [Diversispora eburnea]|uniref:Mitochondrial import inner membrane translocase subunit TIM50 n=1 Tax=Diversispora eburnea TaxID=1213867 RepID=A0A9N8VFL6_9GLOM|nr:2164_t:CDS:10 [Diversispora eburnea]